MRCGLTSAPSGVLVGRSCGFGQRSLNGLTVLSRSILSLEIVRSGPFTSPWLVCLWRRPTIRMNILCKVIVGGGKIFPSVFISANLRRRSSVSEMPFKERSSRTPTMMKPGFLWSGRSFANEQIASRIRVGTSPFSDSLNSTLSDSPLESSLEAADQIARSFQISASPLNSPAYRAANSACRIVSTGAFSPVHRSSAIAPWCVSMPSPFRVLHPFCAAVFSNPVCGGE